MVSDVDFAVESCRRSRNCAADDLKTKDFADEDIESFYIFVGHLAIEIGRKGVMVFEWKASRLDPLTARKHIACTNIIPMTLCRTAQRGQLSSLITAVGVQFLKAKAVSVGGFHRFASASSPRV